MNQLAPHTPCVFKQVDVHKAVTRSPAGVATEETLSVMPSSPPLWRPSGRAPGFDSKRTSMKDVWQQQKMKRGRVEAQTRTGGSKTEDLIGGRGHIEPGPLVLSSHWTTCAPTMLSEGRSVVTST